MTNSNALAGGKVCLSKPRTKKKALAHSTTEARRQLKTLNCVRTFRHVAEDLVEIVIMDDATRWRFESAKRSKTAWLVLVWTPRTRMRARATLRGELQ